MCIFTATTAVFQPPSALYAPAIGCWLPVLWIPAQLRDLAAGAALRGELLPAAYWRRFRA